MSAEERTGWRDHEFSERHRRWGANCPMTDIDFIVAEYDERRMYAVVDYKHEFRHDSVNPAAEANTAVLIDMGERTENLVFIVRYAHSFAWYQVNPLTTRAQRSLEKFKKYHPECGSFKNKQSGCPAGRWYMTEKGYVTYQYWLRDRELPGDLKFNNDGVLIESGGKIVPPRQKRFADQLSC